MENSISSLRLSQSEVHLDPSQVPSTQEIGVQCDGLGLEPPRSHSQLEAPKLDDLKKTADEASKKAKDCGVDIAKRSFFTKLLTLVAASAVLVAAALVTGLTGGAGIPLLVLAGVGFAMAVGDVACAYKDWQSKKQGGEGLAMGGDSLGNALHWLAKQCGASDDKAKKIATYGSLLTRGALAVGSVAVGGLLPVATTGALHYGVLGTSIGNAALTSASAFPTASSAFKAAQQKKEELEAAKAQAKQEMLQQLQGQRQADQLHIDTLRQQVKDLKDGLSGQRRHSFVY